MVEEKTNPKPNEEKSGLDINDLMSSVKQELADAEAASKAEQNQKIADLESKSYSKDEVKEIMKAMLKEQSEAKNETQSTKEELVSQMEDMQNKLDKMSGSQTQTQVEEDAFQSIKKSKDKDDEVELTDEWVLKQKGII